MDEKRMIGEYEVVDSMYIGHEASREQEETRSIRSATSEVRRLCF